MGKIIDIKSSPVITFLDLLLKDKSTKKNIIWATDMYEDLGEGFSDKDQMYLSTLLQHSEIIIPRILKTLETQKDRTRKKAEVFTPAWLCNLMNNHCDEDWFGYTDVFNRKQTDCSWIEVNHKIEFPEQKQRKIPLWQRYVDSRRLEITCGEAPYLVSRYDVTTGKVILPLEKRIGQLDRKLRIINENTSTYEDWIVWVKRAFESCYGYEYQGDNLLIARVNLFLTFVEYYKQRWEDEPDENIKKQIVNIIVWNIWQMNGNTGSVPFGKPGEQYLQGNLFDGSLLELKSLEMEERICKIYNWRKRKRLSFKEIKEKSCMGKFLFDYVIGNPPYQEEKENTSAAPIYNVFMDIAFKLAPKVELITPARFLFNAGKTPKEWNKKMLNDKHFKVLYYEQDSSKIFSDTDITGGIAISYRDSSKDFGAIIVFSVFEELRNIIKKIQPHLKDGVLTDIIYLQNKFNLGELYKKYPHYKSIISSDGKERRIVTSSFNKLDVFQNENTENGSVAILGLEGANKRTKKWIPLIYIEDNGNLKKFKVIVPKSNGSGAVGQVIPTPLIGNPLIGEPSIGYTQSFIGIGSFDTKEEANAALKYIKSKFARILLGILKITQDNPPEKWEFVLKQDFTVNSDIDWSQSVHEIDMYLYKKYGFDEKEIEFIETHVKEMA